MSDIKEMNFFAGNLFSITENSVHWPCLWYDFSFK